MTIADSSAVIALNRRFLLDFPWEAASRIEEIDLEQVGASLNAQPPAVLPEVWRRLSPSTAADLMPRLTDAHVRELLNTLLPNESLRLLARLETDQRERCLNLTTPTIRAELDRLMNYPEDCAGRLMDPQFMVFRTSVTAGQAVKTLRGTPAKTARSLFLIDDDNRLIGKVSIQSVATAAANETLGSLSQPIAASVHPMTPRDEVADLIDRLRLADLPVVDAQDIPVGVIYHADLVHAVLEDASSDMQAMVGASRTERALSPPMFAVRKRLPWLQINLLTAFLAAAIVGLFESTIARFTALAVLLPVVAGQSGNAGAQALAVTMRGITLREISLHQWFAVTMKEISVGFVNGLATAVTCGLGVFLWSRSLGLVLVIMIAMVLAMIIAGLAGSLVPIVLTRLGQDPAQSSSIVLTTITDVAGFLSFLGIATLLAGLL